MYSISHRYTFENINEHIKITINHKQINTMLVIIANKIDEKNRVVSFEV